MSEYLGKAYVLEHYPGAALVQEGPNCYIDDADGEQLGTGDCPEEAWHDAALEIDREL